MGGDPRERPEQLLNVFGDTAPVVEPKEAVLEFIKAIESKVHPRSIEFGYEPDPLTGEDPKPGDPCTWYALVILRSGVRVRKQARGVGEAPVLEALAAAAEALGITVRLRYVDAQTGEPA